MHLTREDAERDIDAWFERYDWLGRMNLMALADTAAEKRRRAHVERLQSDRAERLAASRAGRTEALERDGT